MTFYRDPEMGSDPFMVAVPCWQPRELRDRLGVLDGAFIRKARKQHICCGGRKDGRHVRCAIPINIAEIYVEYLGESPCYSSGQHYHTQCAIEQGLIEA